MAKPVYVPEAGGVINFPDEATPQQMQSYIDAKFPKVTAPPSTETKYSDAGLGALLGAGFAESFTDIPGGLSSIVSADKTSWTQASEDAKKAIRERLGIKEGEEWTVPQYAAYIAGQLGGFAVPAVGQEALAARALGGAGKAAAGIRGLLTAEDALTGARELNLAGKVLTKPATIAQTGALQAESAREQIEQQKAEGMKITPEQQLLAQRLNFGIGLLELAPIERIAHPLSQILTKVPAKYAPIAESIIKNRLSRFVGSGAMEGGQEVLSGIASDLVEKGVYNPDATIGDDLYSNAAGGAFAGTLLEGIVHIASGRKMRGLRQLQADLEKDKQTAIADLNNASVAQAAEALRNTGIEGKLTIVPNESASGDIRYTLTAPDGKAVIDTVSEAEARKAVDVYRKATGANVDILETELPKLNPIRIGGRSFPSIEAADTERQRIRKTVDTLARYEADPELVKKAAIERKEPPGIFAKRIESTLKDARSNLEMFDKYFTAEETAPVTPTAQVKPPEAATPVAAPEAPAPEVAAAVEAPEAVVQPEPIAAPAPIEQPAAPEVSAPEEYTTQFEAPEQAAPEPITTEEQAAELPIGAVELPIEESRVLPDEIIDSASVPETVTEEAPPPETRIEKRPSATDEELTALKTEMFGQPIGYKDMTPEQRSAYDAEREKRYPSVDTVVNYEASPTGITKPRTLGEAIVAGPNLRARTPEAEAWIRDVYKGVQANVRSIVPKDVDVNFETLIKAPEGYLVRGQARVGADGLKGIIDLSIGIIDPDMTVEAAVKKLTDIVNHEIIHVIRNKGVIRPAEWRILSRAVNQKVPGKKYSYLEKAQAVYTPNGEPISPEYASPDAVIEEAVAEMYRDWVKNGQKPKEQNAVGLFNRITEFFRRIFRVIRNKRHEQFFKKIQSGEVGTREAGISPKVITFSAKKTSAPVGEEAAPTEEAAKFSAVPLPAYVEEQNKTMFAPVPKVRTRDLLFNYFFNRNNAAKMIKVDGVEKQISGNTMLAIAGKQASVDKNAFITHLEKIINEAQTGNFQRMEADYSATAALAWRRRSSHIMASMLLRGNLELNFARPGDIMSATMKVVDDPDSLKEVFKVMTEPGPINPTTGKPDTKMEIWRTYAVAKRGEWLRATGQTVPRELTPEYIRQATTSIEQNYPEVVDSYKKYQRFNKKLLTTAKDAGLISQAELGRLTNQMNYYGFIYEANGEVLGPNSAQKTASRFKLRPYTGSVRGGLVNDPMFVMIQNANFWVDSIAKNLASIKTFDVLNRTGEARLLQTDEAPNEDDGESNSVMFFSRDGAVKRFAVKDPLLAESLSSDDRIDVGKFWDMVGLPAHILRESVTRDPGFMARNLMRDTLSSWITSGVDFMPVIGTLRGFATALKDGPSFKALSARGVVGSYDMAMMDPAEIAKKFQKSLPKNIHGVTSVEGLTGVLGSLWNRLGNVSEASDAATRIAVYDACKAQGMSDAEAAMQAIELLDFTRRGASQALGILTKLIPFLNARIQGIDVLYQAGRSGLRVLGGRTLGERDAMIGKKFLVRGAMLAAIATALEVYNEQDDEYKQVEDYIKTGNVLFSLKPFGAPGQFIAVPKPFEAGLLFATMPQQIYKTLTGEASGRENAQLFFSQLQATFGVNPIPQVLLPAYEIITNHSFYTGLPLISEGKARLSPELQYNTSTSQLAMMIGGLPIFYDFTTGKFGGASPIVIDKLISGYGGPVGTYIAQAISIGMENRQIGPDRMPIEVSNLPVVRSFFVDSKSKNPKVVTEAYELFRIADEANRTMSRLRQMGDAEGLADYAAQNHDILSYKKYIFKLTDRLNKLSAQERAIERDGTMTRDEKLAAQQQLRETRIHLAARVDEINKKLGR